jgi:periplasmic divalent cation tolerance protein
MQLDSILGGAGTEYRHCQVVVTTDSRKAAQTLARTAVTARVVACAQVAGPITSTYWWQGQIETAQEWQVVFKTTLDRYPALEENVRAHHTYEVPEILCTPIVAGNPAYLQWLTAATHDQS